MEDTSTENKLEGIQIYCMPISLSTDGTQICIRDENNHLRASNPFLVSELKSLFSKIPPAGDLFDETLHVNNLYTEEYD